MVSPPAKRQKRLPFHTSNLLNDSEQPKAAESRGDVRTKWSAAKPSPSRSASTSPAKLTKARKSKTLYSFFNAATQTQRVGAAKAPEELKELDDQDDKIEDVDLDQIASSDAHRGKRSRAGSSKSSSSKRFLLQTKSTEAAKPPDSRPWAEQYGPASIEELAIHKKKVASVRSWLDHVFQGYGHQRLLILKGPSGSGKSTTIQMLAREMNLDIADWDNLSGPDASDGALSTARFDEFLARSIRFSSLQLERSDTDGTWQHKIALIEEFPNTFSASGLASFRGSVIKYLAAAAPPAPSHRVTHPGDITPIIMIISETPATSSTSTADSFTAHRLFGPDILRHPGVSVIEFNAVAPTYMTKALDLLLRKEARHSGRRHPGASVVKEIAAVGDLRSAIAALEFMLVQSGSTSLTAGIANLRTPQLTLFHAAGKVLHNKRSEASQPALSGSCPPHLSHHARSQPPPSVSELRDLAGTDTPTFLATLHENYLPSCDALATAESCADVLSGGDILSSWPSADGMGSAFITTTSSGIGASFSVGTHHAWRGSTEALKQEEVSFHAVVQGLLFALPEKVVRQPLGLRRDAFQMFYPKLLRLWRKVEVVAGLVEEMRVPLGNGGAKWNPGGEKGVESWASNSNDSWTRSTGPEGTVSWHGRAGREEMLLERLPLAMRIGGRWLRHEHALRAIVEFGGDECEADDGEDQEGVGGNGRSMQSRKHWPRQKDGPAGETQEVMPMEAKELKKLVLVEDDIEDD